jgi:hypothetical protein
MRSAILRDDPSVESFFNAVEAETLALFEHLSFEFLEEFYVLRTREHKPPELMCGFLHCYHRDIYGIHPVERELRNTIGWLSRGFDHPPSRDVVDRLLTDLEHVFNDGAVETTEGVRWIVVGMEDSTDIPPWSSDPLRVFDDGHITFQVSSTGNESLGLERLVRLF